MNNEKYNGWTNYATWLINTGILGNIEFDEEVTPELLQEIVEDVVFANETSKGLIEDYARAFINSINFYEIADAINKEL